MPNSFNNNQTIPPKGLSSVEAKNRQEEFGKNELSAEKKHGIFRKALDVVLEPMFLLLLAASTIYFILGEPVDGAIMLTFVCVMIGIEFVQERKTDKTLAALKDLSAPQTKVIRDGEEQFIPSADLVPGDYMLVSEGVKIPADGVILRCNDLCVDESSLTGESEGVWKYTGCQGVGLTDSGVDGHGDVVLDHPADGQVLRPRDRSGRDNPWRRDYVYAGTLVLQGSAGVVVEKIGASTEYGKIGKNVAQAKKKRSPLQMQTGSLVKVCAGIAAVLMALVGIITYFNIPENLPGITVGGRIIKSILAGIALAMAMIPEEFPVILTVFLSMGAWRLAKARALVRKTPAIETLGAVSVLCVDKTGTITENRMTVAEAVASGQWTVDSVGADGNPPASEELGVRSEECRRDSGQGSEVRGQEADNNLSNVPRSSLLTPHFFIPSPEPRIPNSDKHLARIMGMACEPDAYDPMENAMLEYCQMQGLSREELFSGTLLKEYSFTNELKMMGHVWEAGDKAVICVKGSPESVLRLCNLSDAERTETEAQIKALSERGLRVIAVAESTVSTELTVGTDALIDPQTDPLIKIPDFILDCRLSLLGLVGLRDPLRKGVASEIAVCREAGIRVVMITGDNGVTASFIAREAGIENCDKIVTGAELSEMTDDQLSECVKSANIFSRVLPEHKMRIVKA
ncbi:MAG: HAD-IC family P-type ATPase, partial [Firmicutes bacterium]|nr:HAD-IC family P-type ATPase [Bacillota bacterium]